ncbi:hypothetical protein Taro_029946, partial [Colocasia esculenta]|nr:hypothetical protein [Colocasia esculenta]
RKENDGGLESDEVNENPQESTANSTPELSPTERLELQNKMSKLLAMLDVAHSAPPFLLLRRLLAVPRSTSLTTAEEIPASHAMEGVPSLSLSPPVFIDTNLGTHLAMIVSPDDTVADLKRKMCLEHVSCFPDIGDVTIRSIKVRRRAMYYHLSDSMLVRTAFDGIKGTWFLQMDMAHIDTNGTLARGDANKREEGVTGGPSSVNVPVNADSNMKINDQSLPGFSLMPSLSGKKKSSRSSVLPSNNVPLITDLNDKASKDKSEMVEASHTSENSAAEHGDTSHVVNSESDKLLFQANGVSSSDFQLTTDMHQLNKDAYDKDFTYLIDAANDANAYTVADEKEKPAKRGMKKKKHKEEEEKKDADSCKSPEKDILKVTEAENLENKDISGDHIGRSIGLSGDMCSQILKDDTILLQDIPREKKKRKKNKRKESDEHHNEIVLDACGLKNSALETGLSHKSIESGLAFGEKAINYQEKLCPTGDNSPGPNSAVKLSSKAVGDSTNENHVEMDCGVPAKEKKTNSHQRRKKMRKDELSVSEFGKTEVIHPIGKQKNGDSPEEEPEHDPKYAPKEVNKAVVSKEASIPENAVEIVPECFPTDGIISSSNKKRSRKAGPSKVKSSKNGAYSSELKIEEASVIPGNFIEADSLVPHTNKRSTSSKKRAVKAKESSKEAPHEVDPPTGGPPSLEEQSLTIEHAEASNERATSDASFMGKGSQEEPMNTEGGHTTRKSRRRKIQVDTANHSLVELPNDLSVRHKSKLNKQNASENPQVVQNEEGKGNPDLPYIDISPDLQTSKSSQDHQVADIHNQVISTGNEIKNPKQSAEEKGNVDHLGPNSHSVQQKASGDNDNSVKQVNGNPTASDDSTEEDTSFNKKLYRVAMRKNVSKSRSRKELNQSKQEVFSNTEDNIFGHFTNSNSEDEVEVEGHNGKNANENVTDNSTSDDSEEDLERTQVILGPKALKGTSSQGASPSSSRLLHKKEAMDNGILPSQAKDEVDLVPKTWKG